MGSDLPDVAWLRYRGIRNFRDLIFIRQARLYSRKGGRQFLGA